jgi:DNA-binding LacI/PurR family transcriptional regulator
VPDEVSVVGFDDVPESPYFLSPLTTLRQNFAELGRRSINLLVRQIAAGTRDPQQVILQAELITRSSTARARR